MFASKPRIVRLDFFGVGVDQGERFYAGHLGMNVVQRTRQHILFDGGSCTLAVQNEQFPGMPITPAFIGFEACENLEVRMANLQSRGLSFHESIQQQVGGRIAWFCGPCEHLHCLWETKPGKQTSTATTSESFQSLRIAYYFLAVDDLKVAIPFYKDVIGLPFIEVREGLYALFNAGGIILGLRQGKDAGAGVDAESWTVFETTRCGELYQELETFGAVPLGVRSEPHGKVYWFRAPGGNIQCFHDPEPYYALDNILKRPWISST